MMLRSRAHYFKLISRHLPTALICSAGLGIAGCGGRFLDTQLSLSRSPADEAAGSASVSESRDDAESSEGFLSSLFRRGPKRSDWSQDPFLDTPVFVQVEPTERAAAAAPGVARTPAVATPQAQVAGTARVPGAAENRWRPRNGGSRPISDSAIRQVGQVETEGPSATSAAEGTLPVWARESRAPIAERQFVPPIRRSVERPQTETRAIAAAPVETEGRAQLNRPATETRPLNTVAVPEQNRNVEALLAENAEVARRRELNEAHRVAELFAEDPRTAARPPRHRPVREVTNLEREFNTVLQSAPVPTREVAEPTVNPIRQVADSPTRPETFATPPVVEEPEWQMTMNQGASAVPRLDDDSPWSGSDTNAGRFPVLHEWRGVRANEPVTVAATDGESHNTGSESREEIHQTIFEEHPGRERLTYSEDAPVILSESLAMVGQDDMQPFRAGAEIIPVPASAITSVPAAPPLDLNSGLRVFPAPTTKPEESSSRMGWFIAVLIAAGIGILAYRRQRQHADS